MKREYKNVGTYDVNYNAGRLSRSVYFLIINGGSYT
jgi:hypothetical protein